ncbi:7048_t:CDS:2, partial [Racocetra persica]
YLESGLLNHIEKCKTEKRQQWRNASANAATKKLTELAKYFSKFNLFVKSLKNYSLCEQHYNQIVTKPSFIKQLTNESGFLNLDENERKKLKLSNDNEKNFADFGIQVEPTFVDFGVQVSLSTINVGVQVSLLTVDFGVQVSLPTVDFGVQVSLPDLKYEILLEQIKIAKKEQNNLYEDIEELTNYLSVILEELLLEKNQETNAIDDLVNSQSQIGNMKKCYFCQVSDIDNKKQ